MQEEKQEVQEITVETEVEVDEAVVRVVDREKVEKAINSGVVISMGIGVTLLPIFSLVTVTAVQLNMVRKLSKLYGVNFKENTAKKIITAVIGAGVPVLATGPVELLALCLPVIGTSAAFATMPALNGLSTYAVGRMFVTHFERGGDFVGINAEAMKKEFNSAYQNSREWLGNKIAGKKTPLEGAEA